MVERGGFLPDEIIVEGPELEKEKSDSRWRRLRRALRHLLLFDPKVMKGNKG